MVVTMIITPGTKIPTVRAAITTTIQTTATKEDIPTISVMDLAMQDTITNTEMGIMVRDMDTVVIMVTSMAAMNHMTTLVTDLVTLGIVFIILVIMTPTMDTDTMVIMIGMVIKAMEIITETIILTAGIITGTMEKKNIALPAMGTNPMAQVMITRMIKTIMTPGKEEIKDSLLGIASSSENLLKGESLSYQIFMMTLI